VREEDLDPVDVLGGPHQQVTRGGALHQRRGLRDERLIEPHPQQLEGLEGDQVPEEMLQVASQALDQRDRDEHDGEHRGRVRQPGRLGCRGPERVAGDLGDGSRADRQQRQPGELIDMPEDDGRAEGFEDGTGDRDQPAPQLLGGGHRFSSRIWSARSVAVSRWETMTMVCRPAISSMASRMTRSDS